MKLQYIITKIKVKFYVSVGKIKSDGLKPVFKDSCMFIF